MSALVYGAACEPGGQLIAGGLLGVTPEPTHTKCSGGYTQPGLLGGWTCPCECHRRCPGSTYGEWADAPVHDDGSLCHHLTRPEAGTAPGEPAADPATEEGQ